jgi:hypothetical protein
LVGGGFLFGGEGHRLMENSSLARWSVWVV